MKHGSRSTRRRRRWLPSVTLLGTTGPSSRRLSSRWLSSSDSPLLHMLPAKLPPSLVRLIDGFCGGDFHDEDAAADDEDDPAFSGMLRGSGAKLRRIVYGRLELCDEERRPTCDDFDVVGSLGFGGGWGKLGGLSRPVHHGVAAMRRPSRAGRTTASASATRRLAPSAGSL